MTLKVKVITMSRGPRTKDKVIQIRCNQEFLDLVDELRHALGMNRTELIEHLVYYYPALAEQERRNRQC